MKGNDIYKTVKKFCFIFLFCPFIAIGASAIRPDESKIIVLPKQQVVDKIRGGLLGQILGNLNGLPHEMKYIDEPGDVKNYVPSLPGGAWSDDDTDFEWVYVVEMQKNQTVLLSPEQIFDFWRERINNRIWCSNLFARCLMDIGIKPPYTGNSALNPWASFNISGQFISETFGLMSPAMPRTAARIGLNYTTVAVDSEPAQATQFFTAMIATSFIENDVGKLLDAGMEAIDKTSNLKEIIGDVRDWYVLYPDNWRKTRQLLKEKYTHEGGNIRDSNGHELNTGSVVAALLYGKGDFSESLKYAFNFGWDADCNAATVGTIVGITCGYRKMMNGNGPFCQDWHIVDRYKNVTRDNMPMDETITSFADRIIELFEMVNLQNGGELKLENNEWVYRIAAENPAPVQFLTGSSAGARMLVDKLEPTIENGIISGENEEMARSAYLAVCLGLDSVFKRTHQKEWEMACYTLKGYWKIMNNLFYNKHDFLELNRFRTKFANAGFSKPKTRYSNQDLWNDKNPWKNPDILY